MYISIPGLVFFGIIYLILREQGGPEFLWGVIKFVLGVGLFLICCVGLMFMLLRH